ncbi:Copia protein [Golovinomyces cichoracearum]|uniref:Copia protein n=1 Tax=Golovinomyces cichoracearum TaxID=62708 RepID=A0A420IZU3_9PEZI|nr:Copia protein [Golovinomyces cichoracearum]
MTNKKLILNDGVATPEQCKSYQQRIGNLIYPGIVLRPDISFAASILSRFNKNPSPEHIREAHHAICYLAATKYVGIQYSGNIELEKLMIAASDASFADDESRRSTQGFLIKLFAEIMALISLSREVMSVRRLFNSIRFDPECEGPLLCDNQQTIGCIIKDHPQLRTKMRHNDIHHLYLRQESKKSVITVLWVPSNDQPAYGFTKSLGCQKHKKFVQKLGLYGL